MSAPAPGKAVTIVIQTRVRPDAEAAFSLWQARIGAATAEQPGYLGQSILPANPPTQVDWVIVQRFADSHSALCWLNSDRRLALLIEGQPLLVGIDDVHLVSDQQGARPAPVSIVFSTRLKPGGEPAFRAWQQRVAAAQARAPGYQGYRFEPPVPGVQADWLGILRFDNERNLQLWLESPARLALLEEAKSFTADYRARIVRTGFEQWFDPRATGHAPPAAWKQNMLVLGLLYPVVFLFGHWVGTPILGERFGWPFWFALFLGNIVSVLLLSRLVPLAARALAWWFNPPVDRRWAVDAAGAALMLGVYAACLFAFSRLG